jgi:hypothetical protein
VTRSPLAQPARSPISAGTALRRSLLIWGWGQISLGDKRGYLFAILQVLAIVDWLVIAAQFIDTTLWLALFVPLVVIAVVWVGQAVAAYRRALALGGAPGGEFQLALFLPFLLAVFTSFWIVGGHGSSPTSTVEAYMEAWESNRPDLAVGLFPDGARSWASSLPTLWAADLSRIHTLVDQGRTTYGPTSGLDPDHPFLSLRVEAVPPAAQFGGSPGGPDPVQPAFEVQVVRTEQFQSTLLGLIPTTGERTVVVAPVLYMELAPQAATGTALHADAWRIQTFNELYPQTP